MDATPPVQRAVEVMDRLRSPGGCPWDAAQTHRSLARYLVEECYEVLEAIETDDAVLLREELGDLLLQVLFHARIAAEAPPGERFGIDEVAADLVDKLVRRHPHVFDDSVAGSASDLDEAWERGKAAEKGRTSAVDGVPPGQPALALAAKLVSRARRAGLDETAAAAVTRAAATQVTATQVAVTRDAARDGDAALGDRLLSIVRDATADGMDPEGALRRAARRYRSAIVQAEAARASVDALDSEHT